MSVTDGQMGYFRARHFCANRFFPNRVVDIWNNFDEKGVRKWLNKSCDIQYWARECNH